jgi:hypothetical protein
MPASRRINTQSKPFSAGERAQPGAPKTVMIADMADQQQVSRIDRHAEPANPTAETPDCRWNDIPAVRNSRRSEEANDVCAQIDQFFDSTTHSEFVMSNTQLGNYRV